MTYILATTSELKKQSINNVLNTYRDSIKLEMTEIILKEAESRVPSTPYDDQTHLGAYNRVREIFTNFKEEGDYFVGIESGIVERSNILFEECWCIILDKDGNEYTGISSAFMLPKDIAIRMKNGETHISLMSEHGKLLNLSSKDTWSIYSNNNIQREDSIKEAFRNALLSIQK